MIINEMPGGAPLGPTTANSATIFNGKTAYDGDGNLITGSALSTASTATGDYILTGYTAYNNSGTLMTGTIPAIGNYQTTINPGETANLPAGLYGSSAWVKANNFNFSGNAGTGDVRSGKTFYSGSGTKQTGTASVISGTTTVKADWLAPGVTAFNGSGTLISGTIKSFANCTATDLDAVSQCGLVSTLVANGTWKIEDTNSMAFPGYTVRLIHVLTSSEKTLYSTTGNMILRVGQVQVSVAYNTGLFQYNNSPMFTAMTNLYNIYPNKSVFKAWTVATPNQTATANVTTWNGGYNNTTGYFHVPSLKELKNGNNTSRPDANNHQSYWGYTPSNMTIANAEFRGWTRSFGKTGYWTDCGHSGTAFFLYAIASDGTILGYTIETKMNGNSSQCQAYAVI